MPNPRTPVPRDAAQLLSVARALVAPLGLEAEARLREVQLRLASCASALVSVELELAACRELLAASATEPAPALDLANAEQLARFYPGDTVRIFGRDLRTDAEAELRAALAGLFTPERVEARAEQIVALDRLGTRGAHQEVERLLVEQLEKMAAVAPSLVREVYRAALERASECSN